MTDIRSAWTVEHYDAPDGGKWRIGVYQDTDPTSPREDRDTNLAELLTASRDYHSPDHGKDADPLDIMTRGTSYATWTSRMRGMYLAMHPDVLAWAMLDQDNRDGSLSLQTYASSHMIGDEMHSGVAYVTRQRWVDLMGDDYAGDHTPMAAIEAEVKDYNAYAEGAMCGFIVEYYRTWQATDDPAARMTTWEEPREGASVWGYYSEEEALEEARGYLPDGAVKTK